MCHRYQDIPSNGSDIAGSCYAQSINGYEFAPLRIVLYH